MRAENSVTLPTCLDYGFVYEVEARVELRGLAAGGDLGRAK